MAVATQALVALTLIGGALDDYLFRRVLATAGVLGTVGAVVFGLCLDLWLYRQEDAGDGAGATWHEGKTGAPVDPQLEGENALQFNRHVSLNVSDANVVRKHTSECASFELDELGQFSLSANATEAQLVPLPPQLPDLAH